MYALPLARYSSGGDWYLRVLKLDTCEVSKFPGSDGLYSPRWSPDGSTLAAFRWPGPDREGLPMLYRTSTGRWGEVSPSRAVGWPCWSHDGRWPWYLEAKAIVRYDIRTNRREEVAPVNVGDLTGLLGSWMSLTPNDEGMILRRRDVVQIYALEWKPR